MFTITMTNQPYSVVYVDFGYEAWMSFKLGVHTDPGVEVVKYTGPNKSIYYYDGKCIGSYYGEVFVNGKLYGYVVETFNELRWACVIRAVFVTS